MVSSATTWTRAWQPALLGIGFALLILIGAALLFLVTRADQDADAIAYSSDLENRLQSLLINTRRAESSQRGFLLTAQDDYLGEYQRTAERLLPTVVELREITANNPTHQAALVQVERLVIRKVKEMQHTVNLMAAGKTDEAIARVRSGDGHAMMEEMRGVVGGMLANERRLLADRTAASHRTLTWLLTTILALVALILVVGALAVWLMQRSNRARQRAQQELETTNANLETIIDYRTADLTEANEEIQRFAYIVSHDLRSPLVNIMGFTTELEALRKDIFDEVAALREQPAALQAQGGEDGEGSGADGDAAADADSKHVVQLGHDFDEAIGFIKASITKMDKLINAVLKLSREGRREFKPEYIDMTAMLRALEKSVAHQAQEAGATLAVQDVPPVTSDRLALEQIFSNLLDNAVKYLRRGVPGEIEISGRATMTHAVYEVRDNGRGVAKADQQRIFDLFRRAGDQDRPGEGIGLAHVRALVRRLGGTLAVQSEPGQGSTFTVTLPRRWGVEQPSRQNNRSAA